MHILWLRYTDPDWIQSCTSKALVAEVTYPARYENPEVLESWYLKHLNFHTTYVLWEVASKLAYIEDGDTGLLYTDPNWQVNSRIDIEGS